MFYFHPKTHSSKISSIKCCWSQREGHRSENPSLACFQSVSNTTILGLNSPNISTSLPFFLEIWVARTKTLDLKLCSNCVLGFVASLPDASLPSSLFQQCRVSTVASTSTGSQRWMTSSWWTSGPSPRWAPTSACWSTTTSRAWSSSASCRVGESAPSTNSSASVATNAWSSSEWTRRRVSALNLCLSWHSKYVWSRWTKAVLWSLLCSQQIISFKFLVFLLRFGSPAQWSGRWISWNKSLASHSHLRPVKVKRSLQQFSIRYTHYMQVAKN